MFRLVLLLMIATQVMSTFTAEDKSYGKRKNRKPSQHRSRHQSRRRHQKPENPLGPGAHYCENSHFDMGRGCQNPKTCPENPKSPNYRYRR